MLITRECDYAVRIVRALAGGDKLCVNQICEKEELTPAFVYKILKKLEKGDLVKSFRGSNGGYALKKDIGQITLLGYLPGSGAGILHDRVYESGQALCAQPG